MIFEFDRYGRRGPLAEGVIITKCDNLEDALEAAKRLYWDDPELSSTAFVLRERNTGEKP